MSLLKIFDIAGSGMMAQSVRLNTTASNMANADTVSNKEGTYKSRQAVFKSVFDDQMFPDESSVGVQVMGIIESEMPLEPEYNPNHPMADEDGYIYKPNVNIVEDMANMISASRSYQSNIEVINASKQMLMRTLTLGE